MSDLDALYAAIDQRPDDQLPRFVLADFLEERAGAEECGRCGNASDGLTWTDPFAGEPRGQLIRCPTCSGTGHVPDRTARLAVGYRALAEYGRLAMNEAGALPAPRYGWLYSHRGTWKARDCLPNMWVEKGNLHIRDNKFSTRRAAEDAAALAWADLTDAERAACDRELRAVTASVVPR